MQTQSNIDAREPQHSKSIEQEIIGQIPQLRAFSRSLCRNRQTAEDIAQKTLAKAWRLRASPVLGSNVRAWLFMLLRNEFYSRNGIVNYEGEWDAPQDGQRWATDLSDTMQALRELPARQREALILVGAAGFSYYETAQICGIPVGTAKSRTARARLAVAAILEERAPMTPISSSQTDQHAVLHQ